MGARASADHSTQKGEEGEEDPAQFKVKLGSWPGKPESIGIEEGSHFLLKVAEDRIEFRNIEDKSVLKNFAIVDIVSWGFSKSIFEMRIPNEAQYVDQGDGNDTVTISIETHDASLIDFATMDAVKHIMDMHRGTMHEGET
mmetsp:Transcript_31743/g.53549  ORF Transcript_31743/g.53549 Transcript_31743/m.53549 type:complete len:141 (+) Transcript_31743:106-528(+)